MLSLDSLQTEAAIRHAFDQFFLSGLYLRGTADVLAFIAPDIGALKPASVSRDLYAAGLRQTRHPRRNR